MPTFYKIYSIALCLVGASLANADDSFTMLHEGMPYNEARNAVMADGWQAVKNKHIERSSLYASDIYNQGLTEVVDCVSMELDACRFRFEKGDKVLVVKTITRKLTVDSYTVMKK